MSSFWRHKQCSVNAVYAWRTINRKYITNRWSFKTKAASQTSMWNGCLKKQRSYHNPTNLGWQKFDEKYILFWSDLPGAKTSCRELIKCSCKKSCKGRSNCGQLELQTPELLCAYAGQCWVTPKQTYLSLTETFSKWVSKD